MKNDEPTEVETKKLAIVVISMSVVVITLFGLAPYV
jgi:hypothetical protein